MDSRPVVCHLVEDLHMGGVEELIWLIATGLDPARYRVKVCAVEEGGMTADRLRQAGISVTILGRKNYHQPATLRAIATFLRDENVSVLHTHMYFANMAGRWANVLAKVPVVLTTAYSTYHERKPHQRVMEWLWSHSTDRIIAAAETIRDFTARQSWIPLKKFIVIYDGARDAWQEAQANGWTRGSARADLGLDERTRVIGCVARLDPVKGHDVLINAAALVLKHLPDAVLVLVGDGPRRAGLEAQVRTLGIERSVRFLGARQDVSRVLPAFDVFCLASSLREGCPLAVLEAMSARLPVVASRIGGIPEEVEEGKTGLLAPPGDAEALASALRRLLENPGEATEMGRQGRERYERLFSPKALIGQLDNLYQELLQAKRPR